MNIEVDKSSLSAIISNLEEKIAAGALDGMNQATAYVEDRAKQNCSQLFSHPTGQLKRSISSSVEKENDNIVGYVYTNEFYAPYIEYGTGLYAEEGGRTDVPWVYQDDEGEWHSTSGQPPKPFLRPALYDSEKAIKDIIERSIRND